FLGLDRQAFGEQPHLEEPDEIERRDDDQQPAGALLPVVEKTHNLPPRCSATLARSLSPRPERLTTIRWSFGFCGARSATRASACAGSSAGMMPSRRESN